MEITQQMIDRAVLVLVIDHTGAVSLEVRGIDTETTALYLSHVHASVVSGALDA